MHVDLVTELTQVEYHKHACKVQLGIASCTPELNSLLPMSIVSNTQCLHVYPFVYPYTYGYLWYAPHLLYFHSCVRVLHLNRAMLLLTCSSTTPLQAHAGQAQSLEAGCHGNDFPDHLRLAVQKSLHRSHPVRTCVYLCQQTTVPKEMQGRQNLLHN